jgi:hypothetical protein
VSRNDSHPVAKRRTGTAILLGQPHPHLFRIAQFQIDVLNHIRAALSPIALQPMVDDSFDHGLHLPDEFVARIQVHAGALGVNPQEPPHLFFTVEMTLLTVT